MAINKRFPHVYDTEFVNLNGVREVGMFRRSSNTSVNYLDAAGDPVSRPKGFEDTNLTEDGRVNETGIILQTIGVSLVPGSLLDGNVENSFPQYEVWKFYDRGYVELVLNDNQVVFTARICDLPVAANVIASGSVFGLEPVNPTRQVYNEGGVLTINNIGRAYPANGIRIPRGVRFQLNLRWDRPLDLDLMQTSKIKAEMWGVSDEMDSSVAVAQALPAVR